MGSEGRLRTLLAAARLAYSQLETRLGPTWAAVLVGGAAVALATVMGLGWDPAACLLDGGGMACLGAPPSAQ